MMVKKLSPLEETVSMRMLIVSSMRMVSDYKFHAHVVQNWLFDRIIYI